MKPLLVFDGNNIFHRNYHVVKNHGDVTEAVDMACAQSLLDFKYYFNKIKPFMTFIAFDSKSNWRRDYTRNTEICHTNKIYKDNRRQKRTKKESEAKRLLDETIAEVANFFHQNTKIITLLEEGLEADDMAAGVCRLFGDTEYDIKLVSSDKDYLQFFRYPNVEIINPLADGKIRNLEDWNNDPELMLFEKFIRGDSKDNVRSAYPRIRKTKILEAYYDDFAKSNILNHTFIEKIYDEATDEYIDREFETGKLFEENRMLLDLNAQPEHIREKIDNAVERELLRKRKVNFVKFLQFVKQREMNNILSRAQVFLPLLKNQNISNSD